MISTREALSGGPLVELDGRRELINFLGVQHYCRYQSTPAAEAVHGVALATTHDRPFGTVPKQLKDRLCHILVQPKPRNVTKERQTSCFDDTSAVYASTCKYW
jgi:hypothetical protein